MTSEQVEGIGFTQVALVDGTGAPWSGSRPDLIDELTKWAVLPSDTTLD